MTMTTAAPVLDPPDHTVAAIDPAIDFQGEDSGALLVAGAVAVAAWVVLGLTVRRAVARRRSASN